MKRAQAHFCPSHRSNHYQILITQHRMGQYFKIVNLDKREVVNPWDIGAGAKFWEWVYNPQTRIFPWLLRKSDGDGGGDIHDRDGYRTLGRWAGDRIVLIGDYDESRLYQEASNEDDDGEVME